MERDTVPQRDDYVLPQWVQPKRRGLLRVPERCVLPWVAIRVLPFGTHVHPGPGIGLVS